VEGNRRCPTCSLSLPIQQFHRDKRNKSGYSCYCKACKAKRSRVERVLNTEDYRDRNRKYRERNRERINAKVRERSNAYRKAYLVQIRAKNRVYKARRLGKLIKEGCQFKSKNCGGEINAHHCDYSKPLDIVWCCVKHHKAWHKLFIAEYPK